MWFVIIMGILAFLLMAHPVVFWLAFVPLGLVFVTSLYKFFTRGTRGLGDFATAMCALVFMVIALMVVCIP